MRQLLVEQRRSSPGKDPISATVAARDCEDQLDDEELAVMMLTLSGQDTRSEDVRRRTRGCGQLLDLV
ncbi:hypothetical protein ABZ471_43785 [Streptomyces sp. NPDC005728]|uniref:hypothetical protein n=1 Tax=Streptomyces sp. NPDC005728 TaxID=3157054 RepID=UPI0033CECC33